MNRLLECVALLVALCLWQRFSVSAQAGKEDKATTADLDVFRKYLAKQFPDKKWQTGPARINSAEVEKVYGKQRFYYVFSAPPLPPGANIKEVQEAYRRRLQEFRESYISALVRIDEDGKAHPIT